MLKKLSAIQRNRKELALVAKSFDEAYYRDRYGEALKPGEDAFAHFMKIGWKQGYDPAPWFSVEDYLEKYPDIARAGMNPFRHFLIHGEREKRTLPKKRAAAFVAGQSETFVAEMNRVRASGYFNEKYYRDTNTDIAGQDIDFLAHFCQVGWHEGRSPSRLFDLIYVDAHFPPGRNKSLNPVIDFLDSGLEGSFIPNTLGLTLPHRPTAPSDADWAKAPAAVRASDGTVDVIMPVYRGLDETLRAIMAVLQAPTDTPANLIVIDDKSPEPALSAKLAELAEKGLFTLITHTENLGFVKSVNEGMRLNEDRDVVLLNADTEVYGRWLDHLAAHARADDTVATVTPLSNNATICSYPLTLENNSYELELDGASLDAAAYSVNKGRAVDVPTGVGFCFYIRRAALQAIGLFDEDAFAKGYGEENDFCVRAAEAGWRNLFALDTYVRHHGEVSFADDATALQAKGMEALNRKHPDYMSQVGHYVARDPARAARARLDAARIKAQKGDIALFISHDWGGGIERNIRDLSAKLQAEGVSVVVLRSDDFRTEHASLDPGEGFLTPGLEALHVHADHGLIAELVAILAPKLIHVHSLIGFTPDAREAVMALIRQVGAPYYFTFHDFAPICAHGQFVTPAGDYCGNPGPDACRACLKAYPPVGGWTDVDRYQSAYRDFILGAEAAFAPSADAAAHANAFLGQDVTTVAPHPEPKSIVPSDPTARPSPPKDEQAMTRVAFIGAIAPHKGRYVMESCARDSAGRDLPLHFRLIGYADNRAVGMPRLTITGKYRGDEDCLSRLIQYQPHFIALFSIWPETYSYTLSLAFHANIPPVVFDIGAMAERVKETGFGHCLPVSWMDAPKRINDYLLANPIKPLSKAKHEALIQTMTDKAPNPLLGPGFYRRLT
ncbi:glycosyltransferase [Kordiimonas marina]|uniref:glycosyltransferase n=1 Tax=Kordiimonas marina TaxID=2872312 RepID=UPI001FF34D42|nr:glycosyltransferase [Kordiimonas marina]MCJ9430775.1 glycosyltransferase [Kordiimonas marina]